MLWSRVEKEKKSVIDYVLMSNTAVSNIKNILIDEEKEYPVYRSDQANGETKLMYSDHNTIVMNMNWVVHKQATEKEMVSTKKGYATFRDILEEEEVSKLLEGLDFQSSFDKWSAKVESVIAMVSERKKKKKRSRVKKWIKHKRKIKRMRTFSRQDIEMKKQRLRLINHCTFSKRSYQ